MTQSGSINHGKDLYAQGQYAAARAVFEMHLVQHPDSIEAFHALIATLAALNEYTELRRRLQQAVMKRPDDAVLLCQLGLCELDSDNIGAAKTYFRVAIDKAPDFLPSYLHLSELEYQSEAYEAAIRVARKGVFIDEHCVPLHITLGRAARMAAQPELARRHWRRALHHDTKNLDAMQFLAALALEEGENAAAWALAVRMEGIDPQNSIAPMVKGMVRLEEGALQDAAACFSKVVELDPNDQKGWHQLGTTQYERGLVVHAKEAFTQAVTLQPSMYRGWYNLGKVNIDLKQYSDALIAYEQSYTLQSDFIGGLAGLIQTKRTLCDWSNLTALQNSLIERMGTITAERDVDTVPLLLHTMISDRSADHLHFAKALTMQKSKGLEPVRHRLTIEASERIRIGYLTHDCKEHPMAQLMANVFELHDRKRFEIFCYSTGPDDESTYRQRIVDGVDHFVDASSLSDNALTRRIQDDEIQVLIDLMGHTHGVRFPVLARRAAPIQITWLGYPGTTGADFMDYIFVDATVVPPEAAVHFTETPAYLSVYQPNDSTLSFPELYSREAAGLPADSLVLGCFCRPEKLDPVLFDVWLDVLRDNPRTVLWLYAPEPVVRENLVSYAAKHGCDIRRIFFADKIPKRDHLRRLTAIDIVLDTRLYNGHTTTSDALLAGVPVVTLAGQHFASRVSASLLHAQGLSECVTHSLSEYQRVVSALAQDDVRLATLRNKTMQARSTGPLFKTTRIVREVEHRIVQMVRAYAAGGAPRALEESFPPSLYEG